MHSLPQPALAASPRTVLPVPCIANACAGSVPFVASGQVSGGMPTIQGNTMTISQASDKVILNWKDFNVANGYSVVFAQPNSGSSALNRIWSADPSVIAGAIRANGQIMLINQNGIIFANGAQVNVASLVASSLDISNSTYLAGILSKVPNDGSSLQLGRVFEAAGGTMPGDVTVEGGASIAASGGRVILLAPNVQNGGSISTPDGQAILGAGRAVYFVQSTDPTLRGQLLIQVDTGGAVSNTGSISADRGNATLAGLVVNQQGRVSATSSVNAHGTIYLVAGEGTGTYQPSNKGLDRLLPSTGGTLTLAPGSVTEVRPDPTDTQTVTDAQTINAAGKDTFARSGIELIGKSIILQGGSQVVAPGGTVSVMAAANPASPLNPSATPYGADGSRIYIDSGASIDVSGVSDVAVPVERNLVQVRLGGSELADSPLQRDGFLKGKTVTVDIGLGSSLFDVSPYANNVARGIYEKMTTGGNIRLDSRGDIIIRAGSVLDISGGSVAYQPGYGQTTWLRAADGRVFDIATAPKDLQYVALGDRYTYSLSKWNYSKTWLSSLFGDKVPMAGYRQGAAAGQLDILAPAMVLEGRILGRTTAGSRQIATNTLPAGGRVNVGDSLGVNVNLDPAGPSEDFRAPGITLADGASALAPGFDPLTSPLPGGQTATLSPTMLHQGGISQLGIYSNAMVDVAAPVNVGTGGTVEVVAQGIHVGADIDAAGGKIALTTRNKLVGPLNGAAQSIVVDPGVQISARGTWSNDFMANAPQRSDAARPDGGSVSLQAVAGIELGSNSLIDVSGGGWVKPGNTLVAGKGGSISVLANHDESQDLGTNYGLTLGGELRGYGVNGAAAGALNLQSAVVNVGGVPSGASGELLLPADFFGRGGFASFSVIGNHYLAIAPGSQIRPIMQTFQLASDYTVRPGNSAPSSLGSVMTQTWDLRQPVSVVFKTTSSRINYNQNNPQRTRSDAGDLVMGAGSSIVTDAKATVSMTAQESLTVHGTIDAPAGKINLATGGNKDNEGFQPNAPVQTLLIGSDARLSAAGVAQVLSNNPAGIRQGQVLDAGQITLTAGKGNIITEAGSSMDVSGASAVLDLPDASGHPVATTVAGAAGKIALRAREGMVLKGDLVADRAPVAGAAGGSLSVALDLYTSLFGGTSPESPATERNVVLTTASSSQLSNVPVSGVVNVALDRITSDGVNSKFDTLEFRSSGFEGARPGAITFDGQVRLNVARSLIFDAPVLAATTGSSADLSAPYMAFGNAGATSFGNQASLGVLTYQSAGNASLTTRGAQLVDIRGNSALRGFQTANFASIGDIRLVGSLDGSASGASAANLSGSLLATGDLNFDSAQIYPTTRSQFTINPTAAATNPPTLGNVTFHGNGNAAPVPLSAGGSLTVNASNIDQGGVVRAPLGQITLNAPNGDVVLESGSKTSVSAEGKSIPYGLVQNGQDWLYQYDATGNAVTVSTPVEKTITFKARNVDSRAGATTDLSGGGDLYGYEFIVGPGGSKDVLANSAKSGVWAIVPGLGSAFAPLDLQYGLDASVKPGDSVYLSGAPGLAAGYYALLPARYALLPGAFLISKVAGRQDMSLGQQTPMRDGSTIVAGYGAVAGTNIRDSRTSGYQVWSADQVRKMSQYVDYSANSFFTAAAAKAGTATPRLPQDAGRLAFSATGSMSFGGNVVFDHGAGTRGGEVDIVANNISVVDHLDALDGNTQLLASQLNGFGAETLILGATREGSALDVGAGSVVVRNSAANPLRAPEVILAATDEVRVKTGAAIEGRGELASPVDTLKVVGDGVLLRAASGALPTVQRSGSTGSRGQLTIESGASVVASGSLTLDATRNSSIASDALISAPGIDIAASQMNVGTAPANAPGFTLTPTQLASMAGLTDLSLRSYSTINFYDQASLGSLDPLTGKPSLHSLSLDAGGLAGFSSGNTLLQAGSLSFSNRNHVAATGGSGNALLTLAAIAGDAPDTGRVLLGAGSKAVSGFSGMAITADREIQAQGTGSLNVAGNLDMQTARVGAASLSDQQVTASGRVNITRAAPRTDLAAAAAGGKLAINGSSVSVAAPVLLPSGQLSLHATGSNGNDNVSLLAGADLDVSGASKRMPDGSVVYSPGGKIVLTSDKGGVTAAAGSRIDVSGAQAANAQDGSDAGSLVISSPNAAFNPDSAAVVRGSAVAGRRQGSASIDAGNLANASFLNRVLNAAGFGETRTLRARSGDVIVAAADTVTARRVDITADQGKIDVAGTIDARATDGGSIALWAADDLTLRASSQLLANATGTTGQGGKVTLGTRTGVADIQGHIDVGGGTADKNGSVLIRAPRIGNQTDIQISALAANAIVNAGSKLIEGVSSYSASTLDAGLSDPGLVNVVNDAATFANSMNTLISAPDAARAGLAGFQARAGVEIVSNGDLTVTGDIDLNSASWKPSGVPTSLTLRAAGDLKIQGSISDGFSTASAATGVLQDVSSGSYRLVGGSDLAAANPLAVSSSGAGNVVLSPGKLIRTGDGSIDIAAAGDINLGEMRANGSFANRAASQQSVVYTAGRPNAVLSNFSLPSSTAIKDMNGAVFAPTFAKGGGDISLTAGHDILAAPSDQLIANWLYRNSLVQNGLIGNRGNTAWWVVYPNFQEGVAALGGGNVTVTAGNDVKNLSAFSPTSGRLAGATGTAPDAANLLVSGAGKINIDAGRDILSGVFYSGQGDVSISAGRQIASGRTVSDTNPASADFTPINMLIGVGNGRVDVQARDSVNVEAAFNPTMMPVAKAQTAYKGFFYTYGDSSALNIGSSGGDVTLTENLVAATKGASPTVSGSKGIAWGSFNANLPAVLPSSVSLMAPQGSVFTDANDTVLYLYPSATGNYSVAAGKDVVLGGSLVMSEVGQQQLLSVLNPSWNLNQAPVGKPDPITGGSSSLPADILHRGDDTPVRIVAATGSISGHFSGASHQGNLVLPKPASLTAGLDIVDVNLSTKNLSASDVTTVVAGRDIRYAINKDENNKLLGNDEGIRVGGPGHVEVLAGRNIDLGNSAGVDTRGNLDDPRLPSGGASIIAAAGLGSNADGSLRAPDYPSFISTYITPSVAPGGNSYGTALTAYMRQLTGNAALDDGAALAAFQALPQDRQLPFVSQVLYTELRDTGIAHNSGASYDRGYQAIATLFPKADYKGDLNMFFSQLKTEQGGDINTLAPGGSVSVGVTNVPAELLGTKSNGSIPGEAYLGMLVLADGAVHGMAKGDFAVNTSRILTLKGGDIMLWSSDGNIDAGKGKKTASAAPPPVVTVKTDGTVVIDASGAISGSGIGQLLTSGGTPGRVDLIAPKGEVNAGDAGIRVAGNINIAAVRVVGADNISVGGKSSGMPAATSGTVAAPTGMGDVGKVAEEANRQLAPKPSAGTSNSLFNVEVLGYGDK